MTDIAERPHRLPRTVAPYAHEELTSYLRRLAHVNALGHLRARPETLLAPPEPGRDEVVAHLVALTGLDRETFEHGLYWPGDEEYAVRYACTQCTMGRSISSPAKIGAAYGTPVCIRHRRWLSYPPGTPAQQFSLEAAPEAVAAGRRHRNLIRRHGRRHAYEASEIAYNCVSLWWRIPKFGPSLLRGYLDRRSDLRGDRIGKSYTIVENDAAAYPNVVALTAIIASPYWRSLARTPSGVERIVDRIATDVTHGRPYGVGDPFLDWLFWQQRAGYGTSEILTVPPTDLTDQPKDDFWDALAPLLEHPERPRP